MADEKDEKDPIIQEDTIKDDGWLDILDNGQLKKRTIRPGDTNGPRPERGWKVVINLKTKLQDTQEVIDSETFEKLEAFVGDYDIFHGADLAIPLMYVNEVAQVIVHPRFAYGPSGKQPDIPSEAILDCEIELLSAEWVDEETTFNIDERIRFGSFKKEKGNFWYSRDDFSTAIHCYNKAISLLDAKDDELKTNDIKNLLDSKFKDSPQDEDNVKLANLIELRITTYNNLAAAQMKMEAFDAALKSVNSALDLQPENVKALFRKGKILGIKNDLEEAVAILKQALVLEPETKIIQQELSRLISKKKKAFAEEKVMYKRMLELDGNKKTVTKKQQPFLKWGIIGSGLLAAAVSVVVYNMM